MIKRLRRRTYPDPLGRSRKFDAHLVNVGRRHMECAYDYVCLRLTRRSDQAVTGNRQYSHQDLCLIELWNTTTSKPLAAGLTTTPPKWSSPPVKARVRKGAKHGEA